MAKLNCKSVTKKVKKVVEVEEVSNLYTLELTGPEIATLRIMCDFVGGSRSDSPRKHCDSIKDAIDDHAIKFYKEWPGFRELLLECKGIHFKDSALSHTDKFQ